MSGAQRWRNQSLIGHQFLTGKDSRAAADGHMPLYASLALKVAMAGGRLAGLAKKRWRDQTPAKLDLAAIEAVRAEMNAALDDLAAAVSAGCDREDATTDPKRAERAFERYGRLGYLALAHIEEAAELAQPLSELAKGAGPEKKLLADAAEEGADVRVYLHVTSESLSIDPTHSTAEKWGKVQLRYPEIFGPNARPAVAPHDMKPLLAKLAADPKTKPKAA